jgi:hypothetical protein
MRTLKTTVFLVVILISSIVNGQNKKTHEAKVYVTPEGRIYVQRSLPIYLWVSNSSDKNAPKYLLKSEITPKYANPMYFDGEGMHTIRSPWEVDTITKKAILPKKDIIYEVYADSKAPVSKINYGTTALYKKKDKLFISGKTEITISATDEVSGIENIYISIDGADFSIYQSAITLDQEKEYLIQYYTVDNVGNAEETKKVTLVLDKSTPKTALEVKGDNFESVLGINASIHLATSDNSSGVSKIVYKLDGSVARNYSSPIHAANLTQGEHKLIYYSVDMVNNNETEQFFDFYVDKTPPTIVQEIIGKSFVANGREFSSGRSQLKLTTFDNKAGVKEVYYSINKGEYVKYEKPVLLTSTGGNLLVEAYAVDKVNNKSKSAEEASRSSIPYIDLSGPTISYYFNGPLFITDDTIYISSKTKIALKASDSESGLNKIEYSIDGSDNKNYETPFSIDQEGMHTINCIGFDNVENTNNISFTVIVDNTGPEIYTRYSTPAKGSIMLNNKNIVLYPSHAVLFVSATDLKAGYDKMFYSINGSAEKAFYGQLNFGAKNNAISIKAFDKLGNQSVLQFDVSVK